ncbi:hypothetical protein Tco_0432532 [Tanacetum coccineum]
MDSILKDSVDKNYPDDNLVDTISEMFTDERAYDYSSPPLWDDYDDELFDLETVNDNTYYDPFDSKEEKIKDSKILIDELDPPRSSDFLPFPKCDSVFYEDFSEVDALPTTNNEDKETDIREKDEKSSKTDKTEHEMEKREKAKVKCSTTARTQINVNTTMQRADILTATHLSVNISSTSLNTIEDADLDPVHFIHQQARATLSILMRASRDTLTTPSAEWEAYALLTDTARHYPHHGPRDTHPVARQRSKPKCAPITSKTHVSYKWSAYLHMQHLIVMTLTHVNTESRWMDSCDHVNMREIGLSSVAYTGELYIQMKRRQSWLHLGETTVSNFTSERSVSEHVDLSGAEVSIGQYVRVRPWRGVTELSRGSDSYHSQSLSKYRAKEEDEQDEMRCRVAWKRNEENICQYGEGRLDKCGSTSARYIILARRRLCRWDNEGESEQSSLY